MRKSRVLAKLREGKPAFCTKVNFYDPRVIEMVGLAGFDCVWTCMEHCALDYSMLENQVRAAKIHDMDIMVRVPKGSYSDYIIPLELDATGIMIPHLMSAKEAKGVVHWTRFHPVGRRPIDGGNTDADFIMMEVDDYIKEANRERFVIVQIEDPEPMNEIDEIAAVEGIDILLFGPGDFSHGAGFPGDYQNPVVLEARDRMLEACRKHNRWAGTVGSVEEAAELHRMGFVFVNYGADVVFMKDSLTESISCLKTIFGTE